MELLLFEQLRTALLSMACGILFGIIYDFFKALRLRAARCWFTALCDVLVCCFGAALLFLCTMWVNRGHARLYMFICSLLGGTLYFLLPSQLFLSLFTGFAELLARFLKLITVPARFFLKQLKFINIYLKKFFQKIALWYTMNNNKERRRISLGVKARRKRENCNEAEKSKSHNKNNHSGHNRLRGD